MRIFITTIVMVLCSWTLVHSQDTSTLFKVEQDAEAVLNEEEKRGYDRLNERFILDKSLVNLTGVAAAVQNQRQEISLRNENRGVKRVRLNFQDNENFTYSGKFKDHEAVGEIYLYRTNGFVYGNIHLDSLAFQIEPISKEYAALVRRDYGQFDECPLDGHNHEEEETKGRNKEKKDSNNEQVYNENRSMSSTPVIDVMVLFSNQAAAATTDMEALAEGSIQSSNDTFGNSNADAGFNLVHHQQVNYNETGNMFQDRDCIVGTNNQCVDFVHDLRDQNAADVVILMVDQGGPCGLATDIGVDEELAFAVVRSDCSIGNYTFAHEIGHLTGARHDNDGNTNPFAYGHGFRYEPAFWRTVMAVFDNNVNRIPYWSSQNNTYGGVAMGTANWNDNVRVWNERAATMAAFRTPPPPTPSVFISGPSGMDSGTTDTFTATVFSGTPPFTYQWSYRADGDPFDTIVFGNNSPTYDHTASTSATGETITVSVQDSENQQASNDKHISISQWPMMQEEETLPETFAIHQNYPNPFNPSSTVSFDLPEQAEVTLEVFNMLGKKVATLVDTQLQAGRHESEFEASALSSGNYIARISARGTSGESFEQTMNMQLVK